MIAGNDPITLLKIAFVLDSLLGKNKLLYSENKRKGLPVKGIIPNISQLASETGLRIATMSAIFNGGSNVSITTLLKILTGLNSTLEEFGKLYAQVTPEDIKGFEEKVAVRKQKATRRQRN